MPSRRIHFLDASVGCGTVILFVLAILKLLAAYISRKDPISFWLFVASAVVLVIGTTVFLAVYIRRRSTLLGK